MRNAVCIGLVLASMAISGAEGQPRPDPHPDPHKAELDNLLAALKEAPSEDAAAALETRIREAWLQSGSPAVSLLVNRGLRDLNNNAGDEALADFNAVITLDPTLAEAYNRRALARSMVGDLTGAVLDIGESLRRDPRNFAAWQGLSRIAEAREDWKGALAAWQQVLTLDPKTPDGQKRLTLLKRKVFGEAT